MIQCAPLSFPLDMFSNHALFKIVEQIFDYIPICYLFIVGCLPMCIILGTHGSMASHPGTRILSTRQHQVSRYLSIECSCQQVPIYLVFLSVGTYLSSVPVSRYLSIQGSCQQVPIYLGFLSVGTYLIERSGQLVPIYRVSRSIVYISLLLQDCMHTMYLLIIAFV